MHARGHRSRWAAGGISVALLVGGCTDSTPTVEPSTVTPPATATFAAPLDCDPISVRDVKAVPGDWVLAESVLVRGPEGTSFTATLPADAPASIAIGDSPKPGSSETRTEGLTIQRATVTTDPARDLDPATLLAAIGPTDGDPLSLTNAGQDGFTGQLSAELGALGMALGSTGVFRLVGGAEVGCGCGQRAGLGWLVAVKDAGFAEGEVARGRRGRGDPGGHLGPVRGRGGLRGRSGKGQRALSPPGPGGPRCDARHT